MSGDCGALERHEPISALVWEVAPDGRASAFNSGWCALVGLDSAALEGSGYLSVIHPHDRSAVAAAAAGSAPWPEAFRVRRRDGDWCWMRDAGPPGGGTRIAVDVTPLVEAREALLLNEERFLLAQETGAFGTYDWNAETGRIILSPMMYALLGIDLATPPEQVMEAFLKRVHPEDQDLVADDLAAYLRSGEMFHMQYRVVLPDGTVRWIEGRGRAMRNPLDATLRLTGVNFDVTERRRSEEALRDSEQRLISIAQNFPGIIFRRVTYADGRVEHPFISEPRNPALRRLRDRIAQILTSEEFASLIQSEDLPEVLRRFHDASGSLEPLDVTWRIVLDGEPRWLHSLSRPLRRADGALVWDGVLFDVTEERLRESERERARATLELAMDVAELGIIDYDIDRRSAACSPFVARIFGWSSGDEHHPLEHFLERTAPEDVPVVQAAIQRMASQAEPVDFEYRVRQPDGPDRIIAARGRRVVSDVDAARIIGALSDVTEARRREAEREAALARYQGLLRELNHRLKNNLQTIMSVLRLQGARSGSPDGGAELRKALARIQVVGDLHALFGAEGELGPIDFAGFLDAYCARLRAMPIGDVRCRLDPCRLDLDRAVPLGLVANEVILRAVGAQVPPAEGTELWIDLAADEREVRIEIGWDAKLAAQDEDPLSVRLIDGLCRQIAARYEKRARGLHVLTLPLGEAAG